MHRELALPFGVDSRGRIATVEDPGRIGRQHVTTMLLTDPGERVMRPDHGGGVQSAAFDSLDSITAHLLLARVQERVSGQVHSVALRDMSVDVDSQEAALLLTVEFSSVIGAGQGAAESTTITLGGER